MLALALAKSPQIRAQDRSIRLGARGGRRLTSIFIVTTNLVVYSGIRCHYCFRSDSLLLNAGEPDGL
ncbi:hypothetical protein D3C75_910150 [compost metagenome]